MHFARLDENNKPVVDPISEENLRKTLSNTSLPEKITPESLEGTGFVCVRPGKFEEMPFKPNVTHELKLIAYEPDQDNPKLYRPVYSFEELNLDAINKKREYLKKQIRKEREDKFIQLDKLVHLVERQQRLGIPLSYTFQQLDLYGQQLADITKQDDLYNIVWPKLQDNL